MWFASYFAGNMVRRKKRYSRRLRKRRIHPIKRMMRKRRKRYVSRIAKRVVGRMLETQHVDRTLNNSAASDTSQAIFGADLDAVPVMTDTAGTTGGNTGQKYRKGDKIYVIGFKIQLSIKNLGTKAMYYRLLGIEQANQGGYPNHQTGTIFKLPNNDDTSYDSYKNNSRSMFMKLHDGKKYRAFYDRVHSIASPDIGSYPEMRLHNLWIPIKKTIKYEPNAIAGTNQNRHFEFMIYPYCPHSPTHSTSYQIDAYTVMYFKDA